MKLTPAASLLLAALVLCGNALSQTGDTAASKRLSDQAKSVYQIDSAANRAREQKFIEQRNARQSLLRQAEEENRRLKAEAERMEKLFNQNEVKLSDLANIYEQRVGDFSELSGLMGQFVVSLRGLLSDSIVGLHLMAHQQQLEMMEDLKGLPETDDIERLWRIFLDYIAMQSQSLRFQSEVLEPNGTVTLSEVVNIGPFIAISAGNPLAYLTASRQLVRLVRHPSQHYLNVAAEYETTESGFGAGLLDPSRGVLLSLLIQAPTLQERINQGGLIGYIILLIGAIGLLIGIWRSWRLRRTSIAVRKQANSPESIGDNPLGRLLSVYRDNKTDAFETLELKLDSTIVRELPSLEWGLGALKVFAAIAPLLGLLGTVTGMIETFQAITLFGTGDPKLMAGGISQALVTTALGLAVAVPLILLHTYALAKSRDVREVLEEQGVGLVASQVGDRKV